MPIVPATNIPYDNWAMRSPDGQLLSYVRERKAKWFLTRKLAVVTADKEITLNFKPADYADRPPQPRNNVCVVCNCKEKLNKHHVVPSRFRRHLPEVIKEHNSHDILLLCTTHHMQYEGLAGELNQKLNALGINLPKVPTDDRLEHLSKIRGCLASLHKNNLPMHARIKLWKKVLRAGEWRAIFGKDRAITRLGNKIREIMYQSREGKRQHRFTENQTNTIMSVCREHFLTSMKPAFLPNDWDSNYLL